MQRRKRARPDMWWQEHGTGDNAYMLLDFPAFVVGAEHVFRDDDDYCEALRWHAERADKHKQEFLDMLENPRSRFMTLDRFDSSKNNHLYQGE